MLVEERKRKDQVTLSKKDLKGGWKVEDNLEQLLMLDEQVRQKNVGPGEVDLMLKEYTQ